MACQLLLFEQEACPSSEDLCRALTIEESYSCERRKLDMPILPQAAKASSCIAIAMAFGKLCEILPFLTRVRGLCHGQSLIAVLPSECDARLLESIDPMVDDFVLWPVHAAELGRRIARLLRSCGRHVEAVSERMLQELGFAQFVGRHPAFLQVTEKMPFIAKSGAPLVITGETGTGKELAARAIHHLSVRRDFPFVPVDCGILPEHLVENELFGHVKGAFTDAHADQMGLVALANKGTLFLDEVDALPLSTQAKLLRFLQERTFKPLGSERFVHVDINVIAATNRDLEGCVAKKEFRSDLYYRLNVFRLRLPPLRDRVSDIALLAQHFLTSIFPGGPPKVLSAGALRTLEMYQWPGNVRELFNVIQQATVFSSGNRILSGDITLPSCGVTEEAEGQNFRREKARTVEAFERSFITDLLRRQHGNVSRAAKEAHTDRRTFGRLIKRHNIDRTQL